MAQGKRRETIANYLGGRLEACNRKQLLVIDGELAILLFPIDGCTLSIPRSAGSRQNLTSKWLAAARKTLILVIVDVFHAIGKAHLDESQQLMRYHVLVLRM